jgi:rhodanese-related sulfurtransferase
MKRNGKSPYGGLATEMTLIVLAATAIGLAWNHRVLYRAWTGRAPAADQHVSTAALRPDIPLPLGLAQAKELYDRNEALFVDARDVRTFTEGHIRGAASLPVGDADSRLSDFIAGFPPATTLVVYCNGYDCRDSRELGAKLLKAGCRTVYVFEGGWPAWHDAGFPTEKGRS